MIRIYELEASPPYPIIDQRLTQEHRRKKIFEDYQCLNASVRVVQWKYSEKTVCNSEVIDRVLDQSY